MLNPKQQSAVEKIYGPLLILAGAGSGKTRVLTHRMVYLIKNNIPAHKILAVTFTNKAAQEMRERAEKLLPESSDGFFSGTPMMGTFHSICAQILRESVERWEGSRVNRRFVIFDTDDTKTLMKRLIQEHQMDEKAVNPRSILGMISSMKNQMLNPSSYLQKTNLPPFHSAYRAFEILAPAYQKNLEAQNAVDFDDLIFKTVKLLEKNEEARNEYQNRWSHLLVDEYQDTNGSQYRLIQLLSNAHKNLCVVGDDHQSIYAFRGADYTNILRFSEDFPDAKVFKLEQNYRSTKNILKNANSVISHNRTGQKKSLWTENDEGEKITIQYAEDERQEAEKIIQQILEEKNAGFSLDQMAILYRMNAQSRAIEEALLRHQIPYKIIGGTRFFDRREIRDCIAYLRLLHNPKDNLAFRRIINIPTRSLGTATLAVLENFSAEKNLSLLEATEKAEEISAIAIKKQQQFKNFSAIFSALQKKFNVPMSELLTELLRLTKYLEYLEDGTEEGESRVQNVREIFSVAERYDESENPLESFLEGAALLSQADIISNDRSVTLMTIHAAKGLEFPVVFLPGWEEGLFPSSSAMMDPMQTEEERRLAYVAITRAEKKLTILHTRRRMLFGQTRPSDASRFLLELDQEACETERMEPQKATTPWKEKISRRKAVFGTQKNQTQYRVGEKVQHPEFGIGTIIIITGDNLKIAFEGQGLKTLVASIAPLEIIY